MGVERLVPTVGLVASVTSRWMEGQRTLWYCFHMEKPTQVALDAFDAAFPSDERAERKKMFGMPAGFVNGNMFFGVFGNGLVLRLPADRRAALREVDGVGAFEPIEGRPWKEYVHVDATTWGGATETADWAVEAIAHTAKMPPKKKKSRKKR